ncbi:YkvA family protein [Bosea sp. (in: a-proteobacteria)]|uniref:YkvA family protein n=1 Tax=Bosea sp. (in: a-proteobacteria) TaxID=1871050 RepID=UPI002FCBD645
MSDGFSFSQRFTSEEMAAIRRSLRNEERFGSEFMGLLRRVAKRIPFAEDGVAAYLCARDPATPRRVRYTLLGALGYFVLPVDALPDFLPLVGFTDDAAVLAAAIAAVAGSITAEHRARAKKILEEL